MEAVEKEPRISAWPVIGLLVVVGGVSYRRSLDYNTSFIELDPGGPISQGLQAGDLFALGSS